MVSQLKCTNEKKPKARPRKCTLTQQQRNKKRQRATSSQLQLLKKVFETTQTPTAELRLQISQEIDMTERSVQIWFQNKRAKAKNFTKKQVSSDMENLTFVADSSMTLTKYTGIHEVPQCLDSGGTSPSMIGYDMSSELEHPGSTIESSINHMSTPSSRAINFSCNRLAIGTWVRTSATYAPSEEMIVSYHPDTGIMEYIIYTPTMGFKIQFSFSYVEAGNFVAEDQSSSMAHIWLKINGGLSFYTAMRNEPSTPIWRPSPDFSTDQQASCETLHQISGDFGDLQSQFWRLYSFEPEKFPPGLLTPPSSIYSSAGGSVTDRCDEQEGPLSKSSEVNNSPLSKVEPSQIDDAFPRIIEPVSIDSSGLAEYYGISDLNGPATVCHQVGFVDPIVLDHLLDESLDQEYLIRQPREINMGMRPACLSPIFQFASPIDSSCNIWQAGDCYTIQPEIPGDGELIYNGATVVPKGQHCR